MNENTMRLLALVKENPELPIVPMVDAKIVCGEDSGMFMGGWGAARVDSYIIDRDSVVHFKSDDDAFDTLERCLSEEKFDTLPETESECRAAYDALPWKEAIVVFVGIPDE